jgi:hypothetical protein
VLSRGGSRGGKSGACELRLGVTRVEIRDEEAVVVDQVLRGGALDFVEADKRSRRRSRRVGDPHEVSEVESLAVSTVLERHGDGGAGREACGVGERALVDGKAVVFVGLGTVGREHVGGVNVSTEGAGGSEVFRVREEPVEAVEARVEVSA